MSQESPRPQDQLVQLSSGAWISQAVYAAAKWGIADLLRDGAKDVQEIARLSQCDPRSIYRLLRALSSISVFREVRSEVFENTDVSALLCSEVSGSMRNFVLMAGEEHYRAWGDIAESIRDGKTAFDRIYGEPFFNYLQKSPRSAKIFDGAMSNFSQAMSEHVLSSYSFEGISVLADIGGGEGGLLRAILHKNPKMKGMIFDLPHAANHAKDACAKAGFSDRIDIRTGDFFKEVPAGGNAYFMKHIIHDWEDSLALKILRNIRRVIPNEGKLLLAEMVLPEGNEPHFGKFLDLNMLVMVGGCERTEKEYGDLLQKAGFRLVRIVTTQSPICVIEAQPAA